MLEIDAASFSTLSPLPGEVEAGAAIVGAVLSGHTQGKVFVNARPDPGSLFAYDNGFCAIAGPVANADFGTACLDWLCGHANQDFFILYPGHPRWVPVLDAVMAASTKKVPRVAFEFDADDFAARRPTQLLPPEYALVTMDATLMRKAAQTMYPWIGGIWKSASLFENHGIGFCVLAGDRIVSVCYSVFVSGRHHEIDIMTVEKFRKSGLARAAASAFIDECRKRGLEPGWDCFKDNLASYHLAQRLGFKPTGEFPVYCWQRTR